MRKKFVICLVVGFMLQIHNVYASQKYALVIGNAAYQETPLRTAVYDVNFT